MLGVAIGVVTSIVIFAFFPYDRQAVNKHREQRKKQEQKKQKQKEQRQAKIKQTKEKIANDPEFKKKQQQNEKKMKARLFDGISESDRKLLEEYMEEKRKSGKSDADIIKDATNKAGMFLICTFVMVIILVLILVFLSKGHVDLQEVESQVMKAVTAVFPKFGSSEPTTVNSDL